MLDNEFRPWGIFSWVINNIPDLQWDLLGCLSTEERCLATLKSIDCDNRLKTSLFLEIKDFPPADKFEEIEKEAQGLRDKRRKELCEILKKTS